MSVGNSGDGTLTIINGGHVSNATGSIAIGASSTSTVTVGNDSVWTISSDLNVGGSSTEAGGNGTLSVQGCGQVVVTGETRVWPSGTVNLEGDVCFNGNETIGKVIADQLTVFAGGQMNITGGELELNTLDLATNGGTLTMNGGVLNVDAIVGDFSPDGGIVRPGNSPGTMTIDGLYDQGSDVNLEIELAGTDAGQFDFIDVTGAVFLDGLLDVSLFGGFQPTSGDTFTILSADGGVTNNGLTLSSATGFQFDIVGGSDLVLSFFDAISPDFNADGTLDCLDVDDLVAEITSGANGGQFDLTGDGQVNGHDLDQWLADAGAANLASGAAYLPGDANLDGTVDGLDFIEWNADKFTSTPAWCSGDFTADGVIDGQDFIIWNMHKFTSADGGFSAVPEPTSWLLLLGCTGLACPRKRL